MQLTTHVHMQVTYEMFYEPYVIVPTQGVPRYDERFYYGNDKVEHIYELAAAGFEFKTLPSAVGMARHWPHPSAREFPVWLYKTKARFTLIDIAVGCAHVIWVPLA